MTSLTYESASWVRERNNSEVSKIFFSDLNIDALQDGMRYRVYKETSNVISKQSISDLVVTMRSTYLSDSRNLPENVVGQVRDLNSRVLDFCVGRIVVELGSRKKFLVDASQEGYADQFLPRSESTSLKGHRSAMSMSR